MTQQIQDCPDCEGHGFRHYRFDVPCDTCRATGKVRQGQDGRLHPFQPIETRKREMPEQWK